MPAMASRTAITAAYRKPLAARAIRGRGEPPDARRDREFGGPAREKKVYAIITQIQGLGGDINCTRAHAGMCSYS